MTSFLCNFEDYVRLNQKIADLEAQLAQCNLSHELRSRIAVLEAQSTQTDQNLELLKKVAALESQLAQKQNEAEYFRGTLICLVGQGHLRSLALTQEAAASKDNPSSHLPPPDSNGIDAGGDLLNLGGHADAAIEPSACEFTAAGAKTDSTNHGMPDSLKVNVDTTESSSLHDATDSFKVRVGPAKNTLHQDLPQEHQFRLNGRGFSCESERRVDFFRFGIRFHPSGPTSRTRQRVLLANLPKGASLEAVLHHVWGGMLVECVLVDTSTITPGSWTALVRFCHEGSALKYTRLCQDAPPIINGRRIHVTHLDSHSYPMPLELGDAVYRHGITRCLSLRSDPTLHEGIRSSLQTAGLIDSRILETMNSQASGTIQIRFASVWYAKRAMEMLESKGPTCETWFSEDPCSRPFPSERPPGFPAPRRDVYEAPSKSQDTDHSFSSSGTIPLTPVASFLSEAFGEPN